MNLNLPTVPRHPIRVVTTRTGLSPDLLRAWERRYQVVAPNRSAGGQRLYSDADVERLRLLHKATQAGRAIRHAARLDQDALEALVAADEAAIEAATPALPTTEAAAIDQIRQSALEAVTRLDPIALERILKRASGQLSIPVMLDRLIAPLLWEIGEQWAAKKLTPAHEHLASAEIRRHLSGIVERSATETAPAIVVATPAGQLIELGAMLAAATAATEGWRVIYFGTDLPAEEISAAAVGTGAQAVAISLCHETKGTRLNKELERLKKALPATTSLLVGGRAALTRTLLLNRIGAKTFRDLEAFRVWLRSASPPAV